MAYNKYYNNSSRGSNRFYKKNRKKSKYTAVERHAYLDGLVERGKANRNSRVFESYQNGITATERVKKPLF